MAGIGTIIGQSGGGGKINGILEEYTVAAGETISAGDFVKYVEKAYSTIATSKKSINTTAQSTYLEEIYPIKINEELCVLVYRTTENKDYSLIYVVAISFKNNTYTKGTVTTVAANYCLDFDVCAADENNKTFFIACDDMNGSYTRGLYYKVEDSLDLTLIKNASILSYYSGWAGIADSTKLTKIDNTKLLLTVRNYAGSSSSNYNYHRAVIISLTTSSYSTGTAVLMDENASRLENGGIALSSSKVILLYNGYIRTLNISGTTISIDSTKSFSISWTFYHPIFFKLTETELGLFGMTQYYNQGQIRFMPILLNESPISYKIPTVIGDTNNFGCNSYLNYNIWLQEQNNTECIFNFSRADLDTTTSSTYNYLRMYSNGILKYDKSTLDMTKISEPTLVYSLSKSKSSMTTNVENYAFTGVDLNNSNIFFSIFNGIDLNAIVESKTFFPGISNDIQAGDVIKGVAKQRGTEKTAIKIYTKADVVKTKATPEFEIESKTGTSSYNHGFTSSLSNSIINLTNYTSSNFYSTSYYFLGGVYVKSNKPITFNLVLGIAPSYYDNSQYTTSKRNVYIGKLDSTFTDSTAAEANVEKSFLDWSLSTTYGGNGGTVTFSIPGDNIKHFIPIKITNVSTYARYSSVFFTYNWKEE